ncbi:hypothetical protein SeMB42_g00968 [Synchytrium endobioticum]|uniref:t-SNARE coiled-coil homology domain-containing protein n=1 Tax=Synchytrium endobioticum TaxID=286115 RepID=A0A507DP07_9FUNG|nr:hypothetical protein SeLEV6574_g01734 [Synchytrium endobioticum]TPX53151.1 hypothetical protein SeMB42_g00968 [Synchytrium endobioticum]
MSFGDFDSRSPSSSSARPFAFNPNDNNAVSTSRATTNNTSLRELDSGSYVRNIDRTSHIVFQISNNVASIQKLASLLGGTRDTPDLRQKLHGLVDDTRDMVKHTSQDLKAMSASDDVISFEGRQKKLAIQKLQRDFEQVLSRFQSVSKFVAEKSREFVARAKAAQERHLEPFKEDEESAENAPLLGNAQKLQQIRAIDNEVEYSEAVIAEREVEVAEIERSIAEVNEIFRDLGTLVHEQGYMLDNIESNISATTINMENATSELRTASKYQKNARARMCCLLLFVAIIIAVVVVVLVA